MPSTKVPWKDLPSFALRRNGLPVIVPGGERIRRGHTNGPIRVALPAGYLDHLDDMTVPDDAHVMALSGG